MERATTVVIVLLVVAAVDLTGIAQGRGGGQPRRPGATQGTASIAGRVTIAGSNTPARGAEVVAESSDAIRRVTTTTDDNGNYRVEGLSAGEWRLTVSKGGYVPWQYGQSRPFRLPPPISLSRGQRFTADLELTRGGAISGRVSDTAGQPAAGVQVRVYRATMERGVRRLRSVGVTDLTDDTGAFRVYGLPPGDYFVAASYRVAPADSVVETTYAPTYFPGTGNLAEAQRIRMALGAEASASFPMLPIRPARVSGIVLSSGGTPGNAFLNLASETSELGMPIGMGGVTRSDGSFTIPDVAPGRYLLTASLRGDGPDESGTMPVTVTGDDVTGIALVTSRPATLEGTIVGDVGVTRPLPRDLTAVALASREGGPVLGSGDGLSFEIDGLAEPFRIAIEALPEDWSVKAMVVNDQDALDRSIELPSGQRAALRIVLTDRVTDVSGVVAPPDPAGTRTVVVFPEDPAKWGYRSRHIRVAQTDANGGFRIRGLPPDERYLALATDYLEEGEHLDPEFLSSMRTVGVPFSLGEAGKQTLELKVVER